MSADRAARPTRLFVALGILTALSRFAAIARSPWDWDEVQFMRGVRAYDVSLHAPHPPGYPLFIALAKLLRPIAGSDFRALQTIVVASAIALFPVVVFLARELGFTNRTALLGATLTAFLPNVWFYGGTAMSDVPGLVLGLFACALLLRGRSDRRALIFGALILGLSIGFRTQNVLMAILPLMLLKRHAIKALAICAVIVAVCYGGAALVSPRYFEAVRAQQQYLRANDAAGAPDRLPLRQLAIPFFVLPVDAPKIFVPIALLAAIPILRRRPPALMTVAIFAPFLLFAFLTLSQDAVPRYAIGYVAMHALLAIDGLEWLCRKPVVHAAVSLILIGASATWTWRPLEVVRTTDSPPYAAMQWILKTNVTVRPAKAFEPFIRYYLTGTSTNAPWLVVDHDVLTRCVSFRYERGRLWRVARQRNFVASVVAVDQIPQFGDGWHDAENGEKFSWRWMGRSATVTMPPFGRPATLEMIGDVPPSMATLTRRWTIDDTTHPVTVRIAAAHPVRPPNDPRELGFRLRSLTWIERDARR
jgi:dolichyl-phosphate-mannose-protein mannosyltransferase